MFGLAGRRVAEAMVALFALLGFVFVPLGEKSAFQHAYAILSTPAAIVAVRELVAAAASVREKVVEAIASPPKPSEPARDLADRPKPELPPLPARDGSKHGRRAAGADAR